MTRAVILVLDSFGIGAAPDADAFGDAGSDTFGHIVEACQHRKAGPLRLPHLSSLGLWAAAEAARGAPLVGNPPEYEPSGLWGYAEERSSGKDTLSGHWEMAGVPVLFDWGYFPHTVPCFPPSVVDALVQRGGLPGILGDCRDSGTRIIERLGMEHMQTGRPICYTSSDSVFQIAAHEESFGLDALYELCGLAYEILEPLNIGRVIARPFIGSGPGNFRRTGNRKDYSRPPPQPTLLDQLSDAGRQVFGVGKISDIFANRGITHSFKAHGNNAIFDATLQALDAAADGDLIMANFVDFDMLYGHRRDVTGYAAALEAFDRRLPELQSRLLPGDMVIVTADHGCDPTAPKTDHTREFVPVLAFGPGLAHGSIGKRETFSDIAATAALHLELPWSGSGAAFL